MSIGNALPSHGTPQEQQVVVVVVSGAVVELVVVVVGFIVTGFWNGLCDKAGNNGL